MLRKLLVLLGILGFVAACGAFDMTDDKDNQRTGETDGDGQDDGGEADSANGDGGDGDGGTDSANTDGGNADGGGEDGDTSFSLSPNAETREKSNFCGDVTPDLPDDPTPGYRFEIDLLNEKLAGDGLRGWMHGVVPQYNHFLYTYRREGDDFMAFFDAEQFSLVPGSDAVRETFMGLNRHDEVKLFGSVLPGSAVFRHILVTSIEVVERFATPTDNAYTFDIKDLNGKKDFELFGKVHAVVRSKERGSGFVVEYKDFMIPIIVSPKHESQVSPSAEEEEAGAIKMFRNDIVNVHVKLVEHQGRPPHMVTNPDKDKAIEFVDMLVNCHGVDTTLEGYLVKFVKSPAISVDTYAVRIVDDNGIGRNFTFFPGLDNSDPGWMDLFFGLSEKAAEAWDGAEEDAVVIRNYKKKEGLRVKVTGMMNVVSTEQANPQIYIRSVDDLTITPAE